MDDNANTQRAIGRLEAEVSGLKDQVGDMDAKIDRLLEMDQLRRGALKVVIGAATAIAGTVGTVAGAVSAWVAR